MVNNGLCLPADLHSLLFCSLLGEGGLAALWKLREPIRWLFCRWECGTQPAMWKHCRGMICPGLLALWMLSWEEYCPSHQKRWLPVPSPSCPSLSEATCWVLDMLCTNSIPSLVSLSEMHPRLQNGLKGNLQFCSSNSRSSDPSSRYLVSGKGKTLSPV